MRYCPIKHNGISEWFPHDITWDYVIIITSSILYRSVYWIRLIAKVRTMAMAKVWAGPKARLRQ